MIRFFKVLISILFLPSIFPCSVSAQDEPGLFFLGQNYPPMAGLGPFIHDTSSLLRPGRLILQTAIMFLNTYRSIDPLKNFTMDFGGIQCLTKSKIGLLPVLELQIQLQTLGLYGGFLDSFLHYFHTFFALPNQGRDLVPFNQYKLYYAVNEQVFVDETSPSFNIIQWSLGLKFGQSQGAALLVWFKGPVASPQFLWLSDRYSFGLAATGDGKIPFEFWGITWNLLWGYSVGMQVIPFDLSCNDLSIRPFQVTGGMHIGLEFHNRWRFLIEGAFIQSPWITSFCFLGDSSNLFVGVKGPLIDDLYFGAAIVEEFISFATLEVGFYLGTSWIFSGF